MTDPPHDVDETLFERAATALVVVAVLALLLALAAAALGRIWPSLVASWPFVPRIQ